MVVSSLIAYLTGEFRFSSELQAFFMALQGSMAVRNGANKDGKMAWFHAFMLSTITAYAGASFAPLLMGKPTSMLSNDLNFASCILAFVLVNYSPFDIGYRVGNLLPAKLLVTLFAQLFRVMGVIKFTDIAFDAFKNNPSQYYPIPVFGPIMNATLLGNMGGLFAKGFHGHFEQGMPWMFQNGLFCASFYLFFVHDARGIIGISLRRLINEIPGVKGKLDDRTFAIVVVSIFMHVMSVLQLPEFFGPSFSPFTMLPQFIGKAIRAIPKAEVRAENFDMGTSVATPKAKKKKKKKSSSKAGIIGTTEKLKDI